MVATDSAGGRGSSEEALASSFECARVRQQASRWSRDSKMGLARARESQSAAETRSASRRTGSHSRARTDGGLLAVHDGCPPHVRVMYSLAPPLRPPTECAVSPRVLRTPRPPAPSCTHRREPTQRQPIPDTALFSPPPAAPASLSSPPSCHSHSPTNQEREAFNQCHQPGRGFGAEKVSDGLQIFFAGLRPAPQCCTLRAAAQRRVALCARPPNSAACSLIISRWACMLDRARPPNRSPKVAFCIK